MFRVFRCFRALRRFGNVYAPPYSQSFEENLKKISTPSKDFRWLFNYRVHLTQFGQSGRTVSFNFGNFGQCEQ